MCHIVADVGGGGGVRKKTKTLSSLCSLVVILTLMLATIGVICCSTTSDDLDLALLKKKKKKRNLDVNVKTPAKFSHWLCIYCFLICKLFDIRLRARDLFPSQYTVASLVDIVSYIAIIG